MALKHCRQSLEPGTTLIELVVSVGLFVVIVGLSSAITIDTWMTYQSIQAQSSVEVTSVTALDRLATVLATVLDIPSTATIDGMTYTASSNTFIATLPSVEADGTVLEGSTDTVVYTQTPGGLLEVVSAGGGAREAHQHLIVDARLSTVTFTLTPAGGSATQPQLTVDLVTQATLPNRTVTDSRTRTVLLWNLP